MKKLTFKNVAEMVFGTEWNGERTIIVKTVDSNPPVSFGITVKNIFDCNYLIIGVFGGCLMTYYNWDECIGCVTMKLQHTVWQSPLKNLCLNFMEIRTILLLNAMLSNYCI